MDDYVPVKCVCGATFYVYKNKLNNELLRCPKCKGRMKELYNTFFWKEIDYGDPEHYGKRCEPLGYAISR